MSEVVEKPMPHLMIGVFFLWIVIFRGLPGGEAIEP